MTGFIPKTLPVLCDSLPVDILSCSELPGIQVTGITSDSREVKPGFIFVAIPGMVTDGHRYIPQAIVQGAAAVVGSRVIEDQPIPYIQVADPRQSLAYLSASFYNNPAHGLTMIGVTGTDGKTTTTNLIYQILLRAGLMTGVVSTVNAMIGQEVYDTGFHVTTPQAPEIQRYLARMQAAGLTHVVLETTSHGLAQHRVTGCEFDMGVLTNITHEHLNDHGSFSAYREAKAGLFRRLPSHSQKANGVEPLAVLNQDDPSFAYLSSLTSARKIAYSMVKKSDLWGEDVHHASDGLHFTAHSAAFFAPMSIHCRIPGVFNTSNCLAALAATVIGLGIDPQAAQEGILNLTGIPGRMEQIDQGQPFLAIVDFAHTPNALKQALLSVRKMVSGQVITVFGSAGLRDREKRRMMAEISAELADFTFLTAEDPRTELLDGILDEMRNGMTSRGGVEGKTFRCVADRGEAIRQAVGLAQPGDLVIACGKGHEQSMCFGDVEYPWDDRVAMRSALSELLGMKGPAMPFLPTQENHDRSK